MQEYTQEEVEHKGALSFIVKDIHSVDERRKQEMEYAEIDEEQVVAVKLEPVGFGQVRVIILFK